MLRESGGTMKVSIGNTIQRIYQEQVQKTQDPKSGEAFKKVMKDATSSPPGPGKAVFHPPSGINVENPVFSGRPVKQADPVETMKFAAEVVAASPDTRAERVNQLKALIDSGKYNVSPTDVAEKMLRSGVLTRSWEG